MKKNSFKISLVLVILVFATLMAGCSSGEDDSKISAPDGTVAVTNDAIHFYICHPQDWVCSRNDGMITITPPSGSGSNASVSVRESAAMADITKYLRPEGDESSEASLDNIPREYWEQVALKDLENSGFTYKVNTTEDRKLGGVTAYQVNYTMNTNKDAYNVTQIFAYKNIDSTDRMFTVTFTASQEDKENSRIVSSYETIVNNFNFKED